KREKMKKQDQLQLLKLECELQELTLRLQQCSISCELSNSYRNFQKVCKWYRPILVIHLAQKMLDEEELNLRSLRLDQLAPYFSGTVPSQEKVDRRLLTVAVAKKAYRNIEEDWKTVDTAAKMEERTKNRNECKSLEDKINQKKKEIDKFLNA